MRRNDQVTYVPVNDDTLFCWLIVWTGTFSVCDGGESRAGEHEHESRARGSVDGREAQRCDVSHGHAGGVRHVRACARAQFAKAQRRGKHHDEGRQEKAYRPQPREVPGCQEKR